MSHLVFLGALLTLSGGLHILPVIPDAGAVLVLDIVRIGFVVWIDLAHNANNNNNLCS